MNPKGNTINTGISSIQGINSHNNFSYKHGQNNQIQHKKLVNTGKMILNPYKLHQETALPYLNNQQTHKQNNTNRPTTTAIMKEENQLLSIVQGKAMLLNTTKIAPRESLQSSHQNKGLIQNQPRKSQLSYQPQNYPPYYQQQLQQQQHQQQQQQHLQQQQQKQLYEQQIMKHTKYEKAVKEGGYQVQQYQQQQQPNNQEQYQQKEDSAEGLTLDQYFKKPVGVSKQDEQNFAKLFENPDVLKPRIAETMTFQDGRNDNSSGIVYNSDNDEEFFGLMKTEDINIEFSIQELKSRSKHLSFDVMKCDLDEVKCNPAYEEFVQEMIYYLQSNCTSERNNNSSTYTGQYNQTDIKPLQYFIFNAIEDCLYTRQLSISLISSITNDIHNYPQNVVETFSQRIENKFYMIEDNEKMDECFKLLLKYLSFNKYNNQLILHSVLKFMKMQRFRDIFSEFITQQNQEIQDTLSNENFIILLLTLKCYKSLPFKYEMPKISIEKYSNNKLIQKLYKRAQN